MLETVYCEINVLIFVFYASRGRSFNDFYNLPEFFSSDWLNEFTDFRTDCDDDFRFVYIGPKGTWTPLHADVYCSYSWSANIIGLKRWWIFPPGRIFRPSALLILCYDC